LRTAGRVQKGEEGRGGEEGRREKVGGREEGGDKTARDEIERVSKSSFV
jgi:hypothetical protein